MIKIKERGWAGHFICSDKCMFHRNTLISDGETRVVVSTVGNMVLNSQSLVNIGHDRVYETMIFHAKEEGGYIEADVSKEIFISPNNRLSESELRDDMDNQADEMHEANVAEIVRLIENGRLQ